MNGQLILGVIAIALALFVIAYVLIDEFLIKRPKRKKVSWNHEEWDPIGYIDKVSNTDEGVMISGRIYPPTGSIFADDLKVSLATKQIPIRDRTGDKIMILEPDEELCFGNKENGKVPHPNCLIKELNHGPHAVGQVLRKAPDTSWVRRVDSRSKAAWSSDE